MFFLFFISDSVFFLGKEKVFGGFFKNQDPIDPLPLELGRDGYKSTM